MKRQRRSAQLEYGRRGLIGCLTPQANTTVEPEFNVLMPDGFALLNARLTSRGDSIEARLVDYMQSIGRQHAQFANAPLDALALATTGASYLVGRAREDAIAESVHGDTGVPLITAARAVCDALGELSATRIALISPYPAALTDRSVSYWQSRDLDVVGVHSVYLESGAFHPIYSLRSEASDQALDRLRDSDAGAIVLLGTGLPTLHSIAARARWDGPPVLSCMLCLAWRTVLAAGDGRDGNDVPALKDWIAAAHWRDRLSRLLPTAQ